MQKEIERAKAGYERVVAVFDDVIATIEQAQNEEIEQVKAKYVERLNSYIADRSNYVVTEFIEVADEETINTQQELY